jgi:ankyrin repeat protein
MSLKKNNLDELLINLICDPRQIHCSEYPKDYFAGTMLQLVTKTEGYYWNIFNKQRIVLIEKILKDGANPNQLNKENIPLIFCSLNPYQFKGLVIVELLLKYGADPSVKYNNFTLVDKVNKKYVENLLLLLLKYDYVIVETETPFADHIAVEYDEDDEKTPLNKNYTCCCFNLCCV